MIQKLIRAICLIAIFFNPVLTAPASDLVPGFMKEEYIEMLKINAKQSSRFPDSIMGKPQYYNLEYRSAEMGLQNRWDLWVDHSHKTAVISIRGTTGSKESWLANFYAAMVPAKGYLQLENNYRFEYHLADNPKAAVHTGWLVATGMLMRDILPKLDSVVQAGMKNIIVTGHSQGGGIAYLVTSHLYHLRSVQRIPSFINIKTYCSAAPKPGNLYFAYEYEAITSPGWAYNVVNAADWVPEVPVSIQTTDDYNNVNPFVNAVPAIKKQKFLARILLMKAYKKLSKGPRKSRKDYLKLLGDRMYILIHQSLPEFEKPDYYPSVDYVRTGNTIVLTPTPEYRIKFPDNQKQVFMHHFYPNYLYLVTHLPEVETTSQVKE